MIAVVKSSATTEQLDHFVKWIEDRGFRTNVSQGDNETLVGIIGDTTRIDPFILESMDLVERVQRVSEPFKLANRKFHPEDTVVDCGHGVLVGGGNFQVIAGPCSVEGENLIGIARAVKAAGATMLRGGAFKPRTSPYSYQGMGEKGLDLLMEAGGELDMPVVTEVMDPRDVELFVSRGVDVMQVGARNAQNFPLLRELGRTQTPVLLKRGMSQTIDELVMSAEYVMSEGNANVMLCERGIRTLRDPHEKHLRRERAAGPAPPHAPAGRRRPEPLHRLHPLRARSRLRRHRRRRGRARDRGPQLPVAGLVRRRPGPHARAVRRRHAPHRPHPRRRHGTDRGGVDGRREGRGPPSRPSSRTLRRREPRPHGRLVRGRLSPRRAPRSSLGTARARRSSSP